VGTIKEWGVVFLKDTIIFLIHIYILKKKKIINFSFFCIYIYNKKNSKTSTGFQGSTRRKPLSALKNGDFLWREGTTRNCGTLPDFGPYRGVNPTPGSALLSFFFLRRLKRKTFSKKKKNPLRGKVISPQCPGWHHPRSCFSVAALINLPLKNSSFFLPFFLSTSLEEGEKKERGKKKELEKVHSTPWPRNINLVPFQYRVSIWL